jgi:hypothetical protein
MNEKYFPLLAIFYTHQLRGYSRLSFVLASETGERRLEGSVHHSRYYRVHLNDSVSLRRRKT